MRTAEDVPTKVEMNESSFPEAEIIRPKAATFWGVLRLLMGFTFLWALSLVTRRHLANHKGELICSRAR